MAFSGPSVTSKHRNFTTWCSFPQRGWGQQRFWTFCLLFLFLTRTGFVIISLTNFLELIWTESSNEIRRKRLGFTHRNSWNKKQFWGSVSGFWTVIFVLVIATLLLDLPWWESLDQLKISWKSVENHTQYNIYLWPQICRAGWIKDIQQHLNNMATWLLAACDMPCITEHRDTPGEWLAGVELNEVHFTLSIGPKKCWRLDGALYSDTSSLI